MYFKAGLCGAQQSMFNLLASAVTTRGIRMWPRVKVGLLPGSPFTFCSVLVRSAINSTLLTQPKF